MRSHLIAFAILSISSTSALADCTNNSFGWCQENWGGDGAKTWQNGVDEAHRVGAQINPMDLIKVGFPTAQLMIDAVGRSGVPYLNSAAQNIAAIGTKLDKETQTAITNAFTNPSKAIRDAAQTALKTANDTVDAVEATGRYAERTISGNVEILNEAQARVREGKVVDAVWHLGIDRMRLQNDNAAQLMQESEVARGIAQSAVTSAGGPAGAAAFAAWYTYNASKGDVEKALLSGVYTYAVGTGAANANAMPAGTIDEVIKKAATVAAVKGLAVAAAGGTQQEIMDAIAQGGGEVIVQSGQAYVTKKYVDPIKAKMQAEADAYCMDQFEESCEDVMQYADEIKGRVEQYKKVANTKPTLVVTTDGQWAISWNKETLVNRASKAPGVVLTYVGQGSPYRQQMLRLAAIGRGEIPKPDPKLKGDIKPTPDTKPAVLPPSPKTYEVTFAGDGPWIDNRNFPVGRTHMSNIEFYIDGDYQGQMYLNKALDTFTTDLTAGQHVFIFKVQVWSVTGGRIRQDCATKFSVSGVELFNPQIKFDAVDQTHGIVSKCSLVRR
ncbi:hypothetical protein AMC83_PA00101 (plasmid) [Rhizobium phaseoli]|uniref:hypothetical protein n=1 Tax=Rhizobium phaseoli TaxID=396 RepID=UPI0007F118E3|nr:hypothetical protein [Rhizobium phaseoli]ANL74328.1 hypothetical protein AMC83_PA00101 [Rhizobium phaseoli]